MNRRAAAAIAFVIGCSGPRSSDPEGEIVLRVSAVAGLSDLVPGLEVSGSSAAAMDLVYSVPDPYVESMRADGARVILVRRPSSRLSAKELAAALRGKELVSAAPLDDRRIAAHFADSATAAQVAEYQAVGFDLGPFEVETQESGRIRLARRGDGAIDAIEIVTSTRSDEWRRLLAHELDVVPVAASLHRRQFAGMASVRVLDIPAHDTASLYFNTRAPELSEARVRRRIAGAIRREAIARLVCGDPGCASPAVDVATDPPLPPRLSVLVPADDSTLREAAKILRHQLWPLGLELYVQPAAVSDIVGRMTAGNCELVLLPLTRRNHGFGFFLSPGHPKALPMTGFANPEYDAAVDRGDLATAQAILDREVPVTRLFDNQYFAAVDASLCGDVIPTVGSWLWLSKLYPCEEGPPP